MTGWQWFHMFDTSMSFHHMWSWLIHPLHHRPSWPSWHLVNLTGGSLSVTLSTTSWHKVHHRIEEHKRKMNLNPSHLPQRLFLPSCFSGIQGQDHQRHRPSSERLEWTHWFHQQGPFESIFPVEMPIFFGGVQCFQPFGFLWCYVGKWNFVETKKGFGKFLDVIWISSCERWGWCLIGSVSPCTGQLQAIFPLERIWPLHKRVSTPRRTLWVIASTRSGCKLWGILVGTKWAKCGKGKECPQIFGSENKFYPKDPKVLKT